MKFEAIESILIPSKRQYKKSIWNAEVNDEPWIKVNWPNIRFNNDLVRSEFDN